MIESEIFANLTWAAPFVGAAIVLCLMLAKKGKVGSYVGVTVLFLTAVSSTFLLLNVLDSADGFLHFSYPWIRSINMDVSIYVDTLSAFMALVVSWLCALIGFYSLKYMEGDGGLGRYWFFFSFFAGSMLLIVLAGNLLLMFIGWEGTGLASYALIGHWFMDEPKNNVGDPGRKALGVSMEFAPSHSGIRALVFTRLGDVGLISGIAVIYALTGTLSIPAMNANSAAWGANLAVRGMLLPFLLVFSLGAMAKSAQFPFHEWLVTAMTGPTSVSALIHAATMVKAGIFFMLRFAPIIFSMTHLVAIAVGPVSIYFTIITFIGTFTAFFMATQAVVTRELKLILAFSTASQLGYMFAATGAAGLIPEFAGGFVAAFSHLMSHGVFKASLFLAAGAVIHAVESRFMDDMGGLSKFMKITFVAMAISAFNLTGVPPLFGFWTKDGILDIVYETRLYIPFILAAATVAITAFYSLRLVMRVFRTEPSERVQHLAEEHELHEAHPIMLWPYALLAVATIVIGVAWVFIGADFYSALTRNVLGLETAEPLAVVLNPFVTGLAISLVILGLALAYFTYGKPNFNKTIASKVETSSGLRGVRNFLYDRWYLNSIYYIIFVRGGRWLSNGLFKWLDTKVIDGFYHRLIPWVTTRIYVYGFKFFETGIVDRFYHSGIVKAFSKTASGTFKYFETAVIDRGYNVYLAKAALFISNGFRKIQTGKINHYLLVFVIGFVILVVLLLLGVI